MKKSLYWGFLLCSYIGAKSDVYGQCIPNDNTYFSCTNNTSVDGCYTFTTGCNGWYRSHGTPEMLPTTGTQYVEMLSTSSGSEGIYYTNFSFVAGNNYDVWINYNFYGSTPDDGAYGSLAVYAASGVTAQTLNACLNPTPTGPSRYAMYQNTASGQTFNYSGNGEIQTATQVPSGYNQVWIYPTSSTGTVTLDVYDIRVCQSCYAIATYSSSTFSPLPVQVNGQDITIAEPAQSLPTIIQATQAIYLQPGFHASSANNVTFVAEINPTCSYSNIIPLNTSRNNDSSMLTSIPKISPGSAVDSAFSNLRIYPTVSSGVFFISGSPASLANAVISVFDETGQLRYQLGNTAGSSLQLNLANLSNGLYFVQIRQQSKVTTTKIIINH